MHCVKDGIRLQAAVLSYPRQNKFISLHNGVLSISYRPYFEKKVTTHKTIFQERQESGSVLHLSNAKGGRIYLLTYSMEQSPS